MRESKSNYEKELLIVVEKNRIKQTFESCVVRRLR